QAERRFDNAEIIFINSLQWEKKLASYAYGRRDYVHKTDIIPNVFKLVQGIRDAIDRTEKAEQGSDGHETTFFGFLSSSTNTTFSKDPNFHKFSDRLKHSRAEHAEETLKKHQETSLSNSDFQSTAPSPDCQEQRIAALGQTRDDCIYLEMSESSSSSVNQQAPSDQLNADNKANSSSTSHPPESVLNLAILDPILSAYAQPSSLHPLSNVNAGLDYLTLDDAKLSTISGSQSVLPNRGWSDELCYGTGTVYVGGLAFGGLWGFKEGWGRSKAIAAGRIGKSIPAFSSTPSSSGLSSTGSTAGMSTAASLGTGSASHTSSLGSISWRLRLNAILNGITRRGSFTGNTCGILALMYNAFNCTLDRQRGQHDQWNSVIAGGLTGALFRCTAGFQKMFIASSLMAAGAMGWSAVKPSLIQKY
ncbi:hypothetical protein PSTT_10203, partial [Puccinia striiformis]